MSFHNATEINIWHKIVHNCSGCTQTALKPKVTSPFVLFVWVTKNSIILDGHYDNTYNDLTYNDFTYNDFTYNDFTYNDFT